MAFHPNPNDELTIDGITYRVAEHPAAPGIAHGQEGRAGTVYRLTSPLPPPGGRGEGDAAAGGGEWGEVALKVFKPRFRLPFLASQAERIAPFASLPGLSACRRVVLTPFRHPDLLRQHPDLTYAVLMPWIEGPTWQEVLLEKKPLTPEQSLVLGRGLATVLARMEEQGIAHCDLSAPNVMLPVLAQPATRNTQHAVELVDLEGLYAPGMLRPQELSSGSAGYAHRQAAGGLWGPEADRFAGAVLLAEMLGFCDPQVVNVAWGESYFEPQEMQQESSRYRLLVESLRRNWGEGVAGLFERAWRSDTLADCPTFGEWLIALPERPPVGATLAVAPGAVAPEGAGAGPVPTATDLARAQVRALMEVARQLEEAGNLGGALVNYRQARALAAADPALASLAREIALVVQNLEGQKEVTLHVQAGQIAVVSTAADVSSVENVVSPWLWPVWALVTAVGTSLGYWIFNLANIGSDLALPLTWALSGLVSGFTSGAGQWLILRRYLPKTGLWIPACALGSALGGLVGGSVWMHFLVPNSLTTPSWVAVSDLTGGLLRGISQWLVLRRHIRHSEGWILAVAVGWAMGWILNGIWGWDKGWAIQGAVVGLVAGAITGAFLKALLGLSKSRSPDR